MKVVYIARLEICNIYEFFWSVGGGSGYIQLIMQKKRYLIAVMMLELLTQILIFFKVKKSKGNELTPKISRLRRTKAHHDSLL